MRRDGRGYRSISRQSRPKGVLRRDTTGRATGSLGRRRGWKNVPCQQIAAGEQCQEGDRSMGRVRVDRASRSGTMKGEDGGCWRSIRDRCLGVGERGQWKDFVCVCGSESVCGLCVCVGWAVRRQAPACVAPLTKHGPNTRGIFGTPNNVGHRNGYHPQGNLLPKCAHVS